MRRHTGGVTIVSAIVAVFGWTAFVTSAGWVVKHTVDRLVESPTVEFQIQSKAIDIGDRNTWEIRATIVNLSSKITLRDSQFMFVSRSKEGGGRLDTEFVVDDSSTVLVSHPPSMPGSIRGSVDVNAAIFTIPTFAPGAKFDLIARYKGSVEPRFVGKPGGANQDSFNLIPRSVQTWLVRYEFWVLAAALAIWFLSLAGIAIVQTSKSKKSTPGQITSPEVPASPSAT